MKRIVLALLCAAFSVMTLSAQTNEPLLECVKANPVLSWGGCDVVSYDGVDYLVAVSSVEVGTKKLPQLRTVGAAKAKRELLLMIEGSDVTSTTEMTTSEEAVTTNEGTSVVTRDSFFESIRESADGFVRGMAPLGMWYSDDRSVFFYAIYKQIQY